MVELPYQIRNVLNVHYGMHSNEPQWVTAIQAFDHFAAENHDGQQQSAYTDEADVFLMFAAKLDRFVLDVL